MSETEQPLLPARPRVGLALGSGSARGWAHIGIIQALEERGIEIDVVAGTSIGALVGGAYVSGALKEFGDWVRTLTTKDVFGLMDFTFSGGVVKGEKLFGFFEKLHSNVPALPIDALRPQLREDLGAEPEAADASR